MGLPRRYFNISKFEDGDENGNLTYARSTPTEPTRGTTSENTIQKDYLRNEKNLDDCKDRKDFYKNSQDLKKCLGFNLVPKYLTKEEQLKKVYETIESMNKKNSKRDKNTRKTTIINTFKTVKLKQR
jgi:hypothetical protein